MEYPGGLIALGCAVGVLGTLIGAGGGFVLVPILLLSYPRESPEAITSISLAVVFFNALSGSWAYARMRRIDYASGGWMAAAAIPGAILGALTTDFIPRRAFNGGFGILMVAAAAYLLFRRSGKAKPMGSGGKRHVVRTVVDRGGTKHTFSYDRGLGMGLSGLVGYLSSLLGIGGGIIHVPVLIRVLNFPVHIATATSHFMLAIMALAGTLVHIAAGSFPPDGVRRTVLLGAGVVFGAQAGAWLSARVHGAWIIRGLAVALALVGFRIFSMALRP